MNYKTVAVDSKFEVHETKTKQVIASFKNQDEAKKLMRHLNLGGCFDGFTPTFFIKNTKKVK